MAGNNGNNNEILVAAEPTKTTDFDNLRAVVADMYKPGQKDKVIDYLPKGDKIDFLPELELHKHPIELDSFLEPTKEDIDKAQQKLDKQISGLISPEDQASLKAMQDAVLAGDPKAFAAAIERFKDDPERLIQFIKEMNKNLDAVGAGVHAAVDADGKVVIYGEGSTGVEIDPKTGKATQRYIEHKPGGEIELGGEVLNGDAAQAMKKLGNEAVFNINLPEWWRRLEDHPISLDDLMDRESSGPYRNTDRSNLL